MDFVRHRYSVGTRVIYTGNNPLYIKNAIMKVKRHLGYKQYLIEDCYGGCWPALEMYIKPYVERIEEVSYVCNVIKVNFITKRRD